MRCCREGVNRNVIRRRHLWSWATVFACAGAFLAPAVAHADPPRVVQPADLTVEATSGQGAVVYYRLPEASDDHGAPVVECAPASASFFPVGATVVRCAVIDTA